MHPLNRYKPIADAVAALFHPSVEVVIHDIATDSVYYIANPISGRKPGDISLLGLESQDPNLEQTVMGPYEKAGEKGQRVRAVTAVLKDNKGTFIGLICINLDYSSYEPALELLENLIRPPQTKKHPRILFQNDWRDQIKLEIRAFLEKNRKTLESLTPDSRKALMAGLDEKGLFFAKKSIDQVATIIGVSRATAYKDLKTVRETTTVLK
ncbi:MAG: PAS domain-containing protein [Desulfovibrionales bacterium]|nr:PAS domain-containing protein [Desulfovibrionales bacterium]